MGDFAGPLIRKVPAACRPALVLVSLTADTAMPGLFAEAQWRMEDAGATPGGLLAGPASGAQTLPALLASINSLPGEG